MTPGSGTLAPEENTPQAASLNVKLYTRHGDDGTTGLFGGQRVAKDALRVEAFGTVDELNSALGLAAAACRHEELSRIISIVQPQLFDIGANLCTPLEANRQHIPAVTDEHVSALEAAIDAMCAPLEPMRTFILPGGSELAARLHVSRCVCRRAERIIVTLARQETIDALIVPYMNRLSDLLFAMARRANQLEGVEDVPWSS